MSTSITARFDLDPMAVMPTKEEQQKAEFAHKTIRSFLETSDLLQRYDVDTFLQGSYKNDTNVRNGSDVDMGSLTDNVFYYNRANQDRTVLAPTIKALSLTDETVRNSNFSGGTTTPFETYRSTVLRALRLEYGSGVVDGNKSLVVPATDQRLPADVVPCFQYRLYETYSGRSGDYRKGIAFESKAGEFIVNFPHQHWENMVSKHQETGQRLKAVVRILKRLKNTLVERGEMDKDLAPSYYLECLVWNVESSAFQGNYETSLHNILSSLRADFQSGKVDSYSQANKVFRLFHKKYWEKDKAVKFVGIVLKYVYGVN